MKVGNPNAPRPVSRTRSVKSVSKGYDSSGVATADVSHSAGVGDVSMLHGIPEAELTPKVKAALLDLMAEVDRLNRELEQKDGRIQYLERLADEDPLAPVLNRRAFVRELAKTMAFAKRYDSPSSLIFIDLNGLKIINDTYGHAAGDEALSTLANFLIEKTRTSDVIGRLGGDEFGIILRQAPKEAAEGKAKYLSDQIETLSIDCDGTTVDLSAALGICTFTGKEDLAEIISAADSDMYEKKRAEKESAE